MPHASLSLRCSAWSCRLGPPPHRIRGGGSQSSSASSLSRREQVSSIEAIHARSLDERQALRRSLDRADRAVAAALADYNATDVHVLHLVDEAAVLRKRRNVARAMLLVRISRILTADQRQRLSRLGLRPVVGSANRSACRLTGAARCWRGCRHVGDDAPDRQGQILGECASIELIECLTFLRELVVEHLHDRVVGALDHGADDVDVSDVAIGQWLRQLHDPPTRCLLLPLRLGGLQQSVAQLGDDRFEVGRLVRLDGDRP